MGKKLYRSRDDKKIVGVCGGVAKYFGIDATIVRLIWAITSIFAFAGIIAYIVCAFVIPEEPADFVDIG